MQPASDGERGLLVDVVCWEPEGKKKECNSLLQGCWWWEGCDSSASAVVLAHAQRCTQPQLCITVMCLHCPAVALALSWVLKAMFVGV